MKQCIYCRELKNDEDFNLEHVIPRCLGGALVSDRLKTRDVCKRCNSNLGLFVDAAFEKDGSVLAQLQNCYRTLRDSDSSAASLLFCLGENTFAVPHMKEEEVCEHWCGPLGEYVFWIRARDPRFDMYCGGNPRKAKDRSSIAYFFVFERSLTNPQLSWRFLQDSFKKKSVKKIMCSTITGADPRTIGFSEPDEIDSERIAFFLSELSAKKQHSNRMRLNLACHRRFLAKLAIGLVHCLFTGNYSGEEKWKRRVREARESVRWRERGRSE